MNAINPPADPAAFVLIGEVSTVPVRENVWMPNRLHPCTKIGYTEPKLLFLRFHFD